MSPEQSPAPREAASLSLIKPLARKRLTAAPPRPASLRSASKPEHPAESDPGLRCHPGVGREANFRVSRRILPSMDAERARAFLLSLPHVVETQQWGNNLVFWVGDKAIGGKMFCLLDLDHAGQTTSARQGVRATPMLSYPAGAERYAELLEREGFSPAPYLARIFWVAVERWSSLHNAEWEEELRAAHAIVRDKLPARTREVLALPQREQGRRIAASRAISAARKTTAEKTATDKKRRRE